MIKYFNFIFLLLISISAATCNSLNAEKIPAAFSAKEYQCMPCGQNCDFETYNKPGNCPACMMPLVKSSTVNFKTIKPEEICGYISEHPNTILLDVRTVDEFEGKTDPDFGTLKNAINLPIQNLEKDHSSLDAYKDKEIIVYCSHSHRSPRAAYLLSQAGFKHVINMSGGMSALADNACKKQ